jgi:predicted KAP-like P-loop ATPase
LLLDSHSTIRLAIVVTTIKMLIFANTTVRFAEERQITPKLFADVKNVENRPRLLVAGSTIVSLFVDLVCSMI